MDLILSQSQQYDILPEYASSHYEGEMSVMFDEPSCSKPMNNFCQRTRNKIIYPSPVWRRDSTNRLQRKSTRKSTSYESSIDGIGSESFTADYDDSVVNSTHMNNSSPRWQRVEYECSMQLRRDLMPLQNRNVFNSTMKDGYSRKAGSKSNTNPNQLFEKGEETSPATNNRRNHTGKLKISDSWIDWTPFWSRDGDSKRLDRRHYISDFFESSMEQNEC